MKKRIFVIFMCILLLTTLTACNQDSPSNTSEDNLEDFTLVLDWYPNAIHSFIYTAIEKGYYKEEGLNIKIVFPANPNDGISLPSAGKADLGIYYLPDVLLTKAQQDVPVVSVGSIVQKSLNVVIALKENNILNPSDLQGKTIGYAGNVLSEVQIESMLKYLGINPEDCALIDVGFDLMTSLTTKHVDAVIGCMVNHEVPQMEEEGFEITYFYPTDYGVPQYYELVLVAGENYLEQDSEKISKFLKASQKGFEYTKQHPEEALQILLASQNQENFPLVENVERKGIETLLPAMETDKNQFLSQDVKVWQENADWMYKQGILDKPFDASKMVIDLLN